MEKLSLRHIYKIYDNGTKAVNNFNIDIGDNEFIVFVGPSGCGKSTTLRMIAGLEDITAGDLFLEGKLANNLEPKDRDMAMVFQNYALYPHMTVYDNMAFGLRLRKIPKEEIDQRVQRAAKILDIEDQLNKKPKEMSGGQRQRVALGRAIVRNPKVFLLDEPLSNLDAKLRSSMRSEITNLHKTLKTTFIYVTHDQVEAMTMGTRIVVMSKGFVQQIDSPMNLYDYPINTFVAGFIGTPQMNFINIKIKESKNKIEFDVFGNKINVNREYLSKLNGKYLKKESEVILGVRPEHFIVYKNVELDTIPVTVNIVEKLGNEEIFDCNILNINQKIVVKTERKDAVEVGDTIYLKVDYRRLHLFDKDSEETLLPRIPQSSSINCNVTSDGISVFGKEISLPKRISKLLLGTKKITLQIPLNAIKDGDTFELPIAEKEKINDKYLYRLVYKNEYIFVEKEEDIQGDTIKFSLALHNVDFLDNERIICAKIPSVNKLHGTLFPVKKMMSVPNKSGKFKKRKVFDYNINGYHKEIPEDIIEKIYSVLGKKFSLHQIEFSFSANNAFVSSKGIKGKIIEVIDYTTHKYLRIAVENEEIFILVDIESNYQEGEEVFVDIDANDIRVHDINFDVTLN